MERLDLHVEDMQSIMHDDTSVKNPEHVERFKRTKLTSYFEANASAVEQARQPSVRSILYQDFPEFYTWDTKKRGWKRRQRRNIKIGRMRTCNYRNTERWCCANCC